MRYYWYKSDDVQQLNMLVTHSVTGTQFRNVDSGYKRLGSLRSALESRTRTLRSKNGEFTQSSPKNGKFQPLAGTTTNIIQYRKKKLDSHFPKFSGIPGGKFFTIPPVSWPSRPSRPSRRASGSSPSNQLIPFAHSAPKKPNTKAPRRWCNRGQSVDTKWEHPHF